MLVWMLVGLLACSSSESPSPDAPAGGAEKVAKTKGKAKGKAKAKQPGAPVPMTKTTVYFVDTKAQEEGREPVLVGVEREVGAKMPEKNAVWTLFKGPTEEEAARGLVLLKSGAEGFEAFSLENGVASLKLKGGCQGEGALTVYDLVDQTLKGFETVQHVQILAPTDEAAPEAGADYRPDCLQP